MPPADTAAASSPFARRAALYLDLIRWNRPAGWLLLLWPSLSALWLAAGGFPGWHLLAVFTLGTILMRSAGCCVNDVADRDFDRHVQRTAQRPVTRGALSVRQALGFGAVLALAAFALVLTTNPATIAWSFAALAITVAYPYAKRFVAMPQAVLGIAFSAGIPMAFAAVHGGPTFWTQATGAVPPGPWGEGAGWGAAAVDAVAAAWAAVPPLAGWLVLGNLCWVLAYDTEYAMVDRDDDRKIGIRTSALTLGRFDVAAVVLFYLFFIGIWAFAQVALGWIAINFVAIAAALALAQVAWHFTLIRHRGRDGCFRAFRVNHWLGFTLFAGIVLGSGMAHV